ncbi:MAG: hypothetical protein H5T92_00165 [Synergistales bacterium]|nr:hypothetical protein [Synergistales bacterium]
MDDQTLNGGPDKWVPPEKGRDKHMPPKQVLPEEARGLHIISTQIRAGVPVPFVPQKTVNRVAKRLIFHETLGTPIMMRAGGNFLVATLSHEYVFREYGFSIWNPEDQIGVVVTEQRGSSWQSSLSGSRKQFKS